MNFKRILVLVMAFVMVLGACAPAIYATSAAIDHDHSHETESKKELSYVSIGDSMTNGIGMDGYDATNNNGYLEVAPGAYPSKFAAMLAGYNGPVANGQTRYEGTKGTVNLTQLATSAARAEDIWYIINHGTENAFEPDFWTKKDLLTNPWRWGDPSGNHGPANDEVANTYRESIKNADVISYSGGNGNFGVFFTNRVMNIVGFDSGIEEDRKNYYYMTLENAVELCGGDEQIKSIVMQVYDKGYEFLVSKNLPADMIDEILDYLAYVTASYIVTFNKTMDYIVSVNPDVTVILMPLINNLLDCDFSIKNNGVTKTFNAGDFLSAIYTPVSAYMAGYAALKQELGAYDDATFYYAELPVDENGATIQVETFAQAFDELYTPVVAGEAYPSSRLFCHNRFIPEIRSFVFPILFGNEGEEFNEYDVQEYEIAQANGAVALAVYAMANPAKAQWIAQYLGLVDTILAAISGVPTIDVDELTITNGANFSIFDLIGPQMEGIDVKINNNIAGRIDPASVQAIYLFIVENVIKPEAEAMFGVELDMETVLYFLDNDPNFASYKAEAMANAQTLASLEVIPAAMKEEISQIGFVNALLALYGRLKLAWGLSAHPSAAGHDTLAQSLIEAYENEYTAKEETIENIETIIGLIVKYYDEAYEYGYRFVDGRGYTDKAVSLIDRALNRIDRVDLSDNRMTDEFERKLQAELDAMSATLEEIRDVIANDKAKDVPGLIASVRALKDDVKTHLKNIYALCKQVGIDFINLPEVQAAIEAIETLICKVRTAICDYIIPFAQKVIFNAEEIIPVIVDAIMRDVNDLLAELQKNIEDRIYATTNGNYELTEDSVYVAIGSSGYSVELANLLNLNRDGKFMQFGINDDYLDAIAKADLITIKVNNGEFYQFAFTQIMGTIASILRSNEDIMGCYNDPLLTDAVRSALATYGITLEAQAIELEWDNYLTEDQMALLDKFLAKVKEQVLESGVPEEINYDITPEIVEILREEGLMLPGVSVHVQPLVIPAADLVVYAVENLLYSYVQFMERTTRLISDIREVAPNASVVITHVANPLDAFSFDITNYLPVEIGQYTKVIDGVVDALNLYLYGIAFVDDNTIFVDSEEAQDIYDALNVFCKHKYDGCLDADCNICGQERVPGHNWSRYVNNHDETCTEDGTSTRRCLNEGCGETETRVRKGSALGHTAVVDAAVAPTCTKSGLTQGKHCSVCNEVLLKQEVVPAAGHEYDYNCDTNCNVCDAYRPASHKFGEWVVKTPATHISQGYWEHRCVYCGIVEGDYFDAVKEDVDIVTVIALAVGSLIIAFGASTAIILLIQKKKEK